MNNAKLRAVSNLSGAERYKYFIGNVCNFEEAWGLWQDGWALAAADDGRTLFPFWPAKEFAEICSEGTWSGFEASAIPFEDLISTLLPQFKSDGVLPCIFPTKQDKGVIIDCDKLLQDLTDESQKYE
jgi:hypothetical protein